MFVVSRFDGAHSTDRAVVVVLIIGGEEIHFILAWSELVGTIVCHRYYVVNPKVSLHCGQAFHWYSSFLVLHLGFEGLSGHVSMIGRILLGVFGEKTWFLCLLINLGRGIWAVMPAAGAKVADALPIHECHSSDITSHHTSGHESLLGPPTGLVGGPPSFKRLGRWRYLLERKLQRPACTVHLPRFLPEVCLAQARITQHTPCGPGRPPTGSAAQRSLCCCQDQAPRVAGLAH